MIAKGGHTLQFNYLLTDLSGFIRGDPHYKEVEMLVNV